MHLTHEQNWAKIQGNLEGKKNQTISVRARIENDTL